MKILRWIHWQGKHIYQMKPILDPTLDQWTAGDGAMRTKTVWLIRSELTQVRSKRVKLLKSFSRGKGDGRTFHNILNACSERSFETRIRQGRSRKCTNSIMIELSSAVAKTALTEGDWQYYERNQGLAYMEIQKKDYLKLEQLYMLKTRNGLHWTNLIEKK